MPILLMGKINLKYILDIGCGHSAWFLKCNNFFPILNICYLMQIKLMKIN